MSQLIQAAASVAPSVTPQVVTVTKTVVVDHTSHLFQLAQIVKYLGAGAGLSVVHSVLERGKLPKWLNTLLPVVYSGVLSVVSLFVAGSLDLSNWYQAFLQILAGAVTWYALLTVVNKAQSASAATALPVETAV